MRAQRGLSVQTLLQSHLSFEVNSFPCKAAGGGGCCLLKWGTLINHSCAPNVAFCSAVVDGAVEGHFRALVAIEAGEELGSSYIQAPQPTSFWHI